MPYLLQDEDWRLINQYWGVVLPLFVQFKHELEDDNKKLIRRRS